MEINNDTMTSMEMLEKLAELDHGQTQLKELNSTMRLWLDVADEDMAALRSENIGLRKQVKSLERLIAEAQEDEMEPCGSLRTDELHMERCSEKKIQKLEEESLVMKEESMKISEELKNLQEEREQDKIKLSELKAALKTLEFEKEEAHAGLQQRDESLHQKNLQLMHFEQTVEEFSTIIKDLRQTNQVLREECDDRQDVTALSALNDLMEEKPRAATPSLSFLEEMKLLASSGEMIHFSSGNTNPENETEPEELLEPQSLTKHLQEKSRTGTPQTLFQRAGLFVCIFLLLVLVFVASGIISGNCSVFFPITSRRTGAHMTLQSFCSVHYDSVPPV